MTAMKLQKLVYYSQAWALVLLGRPLFSEEFRAWREGPVCGPLYHGHRGQFLVSSWPGNPDALRQDEADAVRRVLCAYGDKNASWLSDLTHREQPWIDARKGLGPGENGTIVITKESMRTYYSGADSSEARAVNGKFNPLIATLDNLSDDEAELLGELAARDLAEAE